jgi:hypothetical protein
LKSSVEDFAVAVVVVFVLGAGLALREARAMKGSDIRNDERKKS